MAAIDYSAAADYLQKNLALEADSWLVQQVKSGVIDETALDAFASIVSTGGPDSGHRGKMAAQAILRQHQSREIH
jgi:hypothetical protein